MQMKLLLIRMKSSGWVLIFILHYRFLWHAIGQTASTKLEGRHGPCCGRVVKLVTVDQEW